MKLTEARARVLREIIHGKSVHKETYGPCSYGASPRGYGCTTDVSRLVAPLYRADLIKLVNGHNGWRNGWAPTDAGIAALAAYDKNGA